MDQQRLERLSASGDRPALASLVRGMRRRNDLDKAVQATQAWWRSQRGEVLTYLDEVEYHLAEYGILSDLVHCVALPFLRALGTWDDFACSAGSLPPVGDALMVYNCLEFRGSSWSVSFDPSGAGWQCHLRAASRLPCQRPLAQVPLAVPLLER